MRRGLPEHPRGHDLPSVVNAPNIPAPNVRMDTQLLRSIQHYTARAAITSYSMRGAGSAGVVESAREFLAVLPLEQFGTSSKSKFLSGLDHTTLELTRALPKGAQRWGLARKGLNIFLRGCLYTTYLRDAFNLAAAEEYFEVPLDSITGDRLVKESRGALTPWKTVRGLRPRASAEYQAVAATLAVERGFARVHLDAVWWGEREGEDS